MLTKPARTLFFLYLPLNAVHTPLEAKDSDLALFPNLSGETQIRAAMTYAMDRAVGQVLGTLTQDGLDSNTLVFFWATTEARLVPERTTRP